MAAVVRMKLPVRIAAWEPQCHGEEHAKVNAAVVKALCLVDPHSTLLCMAERTHLGAMQDELGEEFSANLILRPVCTPARRATPAQRFRRDIGRAMSVLLAAPSARLIVMLSVEPSSILAMRIALLLRPRRAQPRVIIIPHSALAAITARRAARPWYWILNMRLTLRLCGTRFRLLLLGKVIRRNLHRILPLLASRSVAVDHPYIFHKEVAHTHAHVLGEMIFAFVGVGHRGKGYDAYVELARAFARRPPAIAVRFICVGAVIEPDLLAASAGCIELPETNVLPRIDYDSKLSSITYAIFPYPVGGYALYPSGAFFDAVQHLKPMICLRNDFFNHYFNELGDIGYLCDSPADMEATMRSIADHFPSERYARQRQNLLRSHERFSPATLASRLGPLLLVGRQP